MNDKYIIYFISKAKSHMIKFIENNLKEQELNDLIPTHGNILTALYESKTKLTMKDISNKIGKDKSTVTALISKLETLGYVKKEKCTMDKRVTYINLTDQSINIKDKFDIISQKVNQTAYAGLTNDEKKEFLRILKKISINFKEEIKKSN
ncbi:MAG: MarR family winged helix-turn-helix transcriptional regulator [Peptostreptococcaceae bacterium]